MYIDIHGCSYALTHCTCVRYVNKLVHHSDVGYSSGITRQCSRAQDTASTEYAVTGGRIAASLISWLLRQAARWRSPSQMRRHRRTRGCPVCRAPLKSCAASVSNSLAAGTATKPRPASQVNAELQPLGCRCRFLVYITQRLKSAILWACTIRKEGADKDAQC